MVCQGFRKRMCWNRTQGRNRYCASCQLLADKAKIEDLVSKIPEFDQGPENLLNLCTAESVQAILKEQIHQDLLEQVCVALYKKDKPTALMFVQMINNSDLHIPFLHLLRSHNESPFCNLMCLLLTHQVYKDSLLPHNCLRCTASMFRYKQDPSVKLSIHTELIMLTWSHPGGNLNRLLDRALNQPTGLDQVENFCASFLEGPFSKELVEHEFPRILQAISRKLIQRPLAYPQPIPRKFPSRVLLHPLVMPSLFLQEDPWSFMVKHKLKTRIDIFREELIAKSWHPSRFYFWCIDTSEKKEDLADGMDEPEEPILRRSRADWNISWN